MAFIAKKRVALFIDFSITVPAVKAFYGVLIVVFCASCAHTGGEKDGVPSVSKASLINVPDAVPKKETITRAGNKNPYKVFGKTYHLLPSSEGYRASGMASWYGTKFHGRNTANGEVYDIRAMTAAHKTLPIPCYVKVTNTLNNKSVVVRVNDRGPFHGDRLIDLSYAAAVKLGYADRGTAPVKIEVVSPSSTGRSANTMAVKQHKPMVKSVNTLSVETASLSQPLREAPQIPAVKRAATAGQVWYLQAGAFGDLQSARKLQDRLKYITQMPVHIVEPDTASDIYRVRIGPSKEQSSLVKLQQEMLAVRMGQPFIVRDNKSQ